VVNKRSTAGVASNCAMIFELSFNLLHKSSQIGNSLPASSIEIAIQLNRALILRHPVPGNLVFENLRNIGIKALAFLRRFNNQTLV
jgi:hypothetical protein